MIGVLAADTCRTAVAQRAEEDSMAGIYATKKRYKIEFAGRIPAIYMSGASEDAALIRAIHRLKKEKRVAISEWVPVGGDANYQFFDDDEQKLQKKREQLLKQLGAPDQRLGIANQEQGGESDDTES